MPSLRCAVLALLLLWSSDGSDGTGEGQQIKVSCSFCEGQHELQRRRRIPAALLCGEARAVRGCGGSGYCDA